MEDSDDNLSFVSASDSEFETDHLLHTLVVNPPEKVQRASSPACSLTSRSSFRRTAPKRPAPQPPSMAVCSEGVSHNNRSKTTFLQQFQNIIEKNTSGYGSASERDINDITSLPNHSLSSAVVKETPVPNTSVQKIQGATTHAKDFSNLQIKLIDDVTEPLSQSLPLSSNSEGLAQVSSYIHEHKTTSGSSSIYTTLSAKPSSSDAPFYMSSMHPADFDRGLFSPQYVPLDSLHYVPQITAQPQTMFNMPLASQSAYGDVLLTERRSHNSLSHSASDPGLNQMLRSSLLVHAGTLDSLSETEENNEDEYEEVFVGQSNDACRELVPIKANKGRRRLERSDSDNVAHLYEDLLVSTHLNLKVTFTNLSIVVVAATFFMPNSASVLYNLFRLVFGTLFPAYYSYKAVRTKNVKEYVKWMMYWIVFAFFTCAETITDVFVSFWFPFYYEIKILVVLWLLSPATRGSSILYRKFVHPWLTKKEEEIDDCIAKARQQGYSTVVQLGTKGVNYATSVIMQTAIKGGGGIVNQLKRSYSASEIGEDTGDLNRNVKALPPKETCYLSPSEEDDVSVSSGSFESEPRHRAESESSTTRTRGHSAGRSVRTGKARSADVSDVYFHDVTDSVTQKRSPRTHDAGRTTEGAHQNVTRRTRSGDVSSYATLPRATTKRSTIKKRQP